MITSRHRAEHNPDRVCFRPACGTPVTTGGTDEERPTVTVPFAEPPPGSEPHPEDPEEIRNLGHAPV